MKRQLVFRTTNGRIYDFSVRKEFKDERHENNFIALMNRKGYILDEVFHLD